MIEDKNYEASIIIDWIENNSLLVVGDGIMKDLSSREDRLI